MIRSRVERPDRVAQFICQKQIYMLGTSLCFIEGYKKTSLIECAPKDALYCCFLSVLWVIRFTLK